MCCWVAQVRSIVETLLEVLTTPSQAVQRAVSGCLPPLMTGLSSDAEYVAGLVSRLLAMVQSPSYGDRCDLAPACAPHAPAGELCIAACLCTPLELGGLGAYHQWQQGIWKLKIDRRSQRYFLSLMLRTEIR